MPDNICIEAPDKFNENYLLSHLVQRLNGNPSGGYSDFLNNEILAGIGVEKMSVLSCYLLSNVNYDEVASIRKSNFQYLHDRFKGLNRISIFADKRPVPMCYPLLLDIKIDKRALALKDIFIPSFWQDTLDRCPGFDLEKNLTVYLLPLPLDHRYGETDLDNMVNKIIDTIN